MTDKPKSPLAVPGSTVLLFRADSPWVVGSITAAISISQMLVAQLVGRGGDTVLRRLRSRERLLTDQRIFAP
jgi:DNA-binding MurR/RpiR family transcriptional regulator